MADNYARVKALLSEVEMASINELPEIARKFDELKIDVEKELGKYGDDLDGEEKSDEEDRISSLWYLAVEGGRARDVYDFKYLLEDKLKSYVRSLPEETSPDEIIRLEKMKKKGLIESIRLHKTTKEADVVQAMFPFLPFEDQSFDSFVAFYSISTYVFSSLEREDFEKYWSEIDRVLKFGGKAYIGPIWNGNMDAFYGSLNDYMVDHGWIIAREEESPNIRPIYGQGVLVITKKNYEKVQDLESPDEKEFRNKVARAKLKDVDQDDLDY